MYAPLLPLYMAYVCAHVCPIAAPMWPMYARMHALMLLPCGPYMRPCMPHCCSHVAHVCPHIWPMYARMHAPLLLPCDPCVPPYMAHVCAHACPIAAPMWPMYARMHAPLSGTKIRTIRKAVKKRQALCLIWTSLLALAIYSI